MKIVLDTNVLVSGLLTPFGPSGEIVRMVSAGELISYIDARILSEYQEVLHRPKFKFNKDHISILLDFIKIYGQFVSSLPLKNRLPDPDDEPFLEVAIGRVWHRIVEMILNPRRHPLNTENPTFDSFECCAI